MKIFYLCHVNWYWIFQRPQILALKLQEAFDVTVVNKQVLLKKVDARNNKRPRDMNTIWQLPKEDIFPFFKFLNRWYFKYKISKASNYDAMWLCHPSQFKLIPKDYNGIVIYDCMDNHVALAPAEEKKNIHNNEQQLIKRADIIFASSNRLIETIPGLEKAILIRNGYVCSQSHDIATPHTSELRRIAYIGTIDNWFDYGLLNHSTKTFSNVEYHLIGPVRQSNPEDNKKVIYDGIAQHNELYHKIENYDVLIMPFVVNDIILAVDPVKLYEYISFGKCIISVWYPEIDRFSDFVYFYHNSSEYVQLLDKLIKEGFQPKYNKIMQEEFLNKNSWNNRIDKIKEIINNYSSIKK